MIVSGHRKSLGNGAHLGKLYWHKKVPTFLAPGTGFVEDNFFHGLGWGGGFRMIQEHSIYWAFYFYYCYISSSSDHQALDVGTSIFDNGWHTRSSDRMKLLWVGGIRNGMMCWEMYELSLQTKLKFYPPFSYYMLCDISKFLDLCKSQFKFLSNKNHYIYIYTHTHWNISNEDRRRICTASLVTCMLKCRHFVSLTHCLLLDLQVWVTVLPCSTVSAHPFTTAGWVL